MGSRCSGRNPHHGAYIKGCHDCLNALQEEGIYAHNIPTERCEMVEETYKHLVAMKKHKWLAVSVVYTYREELAQCSFGEGVMSLGLVKAEWFGRALQVMEGDPCLLAKMNLGMPPCGGYGCDLHKPRSVAPRVVYDLASSRVDKINNSCEKCKIAAEKETDTAVDGYSRRRCPRWEESEWLKWRYMGKKVGGERLDYTAARAVEYR